MDAEIEKKIARVANEYLDKVLKNRGDPMPLRLHDAILEACQFTERVTMERAARICRERLPALVHVQKSLGADEYGAICAVIGRKQQVEACAEAIEAAAKEEK